MEYWEKQPAVPGREQWRMAREALRVRNATPPGRGAAAPLSPSQWPPVVVAHTQAPSP